MDLGEYTFGDAELAIAAKAHQHDCFGDAQLASRF